MYPMTDPSMMLHLYHERAADLYREAEGRRLVREAREARHSQVGRRHRASARPRPAGAPVMP
jgi:hypothetical protein